MSSLLESNPEAVQAVASPNDRQVGGNHYAAEFQHWDFVPRLGLCWQEGCGTKYLARIFKKHAADPRKVIEDMEKVIHYVEKQIELVEEGIVFPHPNFPAYSAYHQAVYRKWIDQQDFGTNDLDLVSEVQDVLVAYSKWSWNLHGPAAGLVEVIQRMTGLINMYKKTLPSAKDADRADLLGADGVSSSSMPVTEEEENEYAKDIRRMSLSSQLVAGTAFDEAPPIEGDGESGPLEGLVQETMQKIADGLGVIPESLMQDPMKEDPPVVEQRAYIGQAKDVGSSAAVEGSVPSVAPAAKSLEDALIEQSRLSLQMLMQNQPLSTPVEVYSRLLEEVRRFEDTYPLDLSPRLTASGEDKEQFSSFRDYAEALNKMSLGLRTLDESLPNKQLTRSTIALWAVLDGVTNLQHWMLRLTEGDNPVLKDEVVANYTRLQIRKCTAVLHQNALVWMAKHHMDPGVYTLGTSLMQPANGSQEV